MKNFLFKDKQNQGQTLIETLAAIFVLVMGIASSVGLSVYTLNSSGNIASQVVGIGLAREALESFRNMRDTNWLKDSIRSDCYNYISPSLDDEKCYSRWKQNGSGYDISDPGAGKFYTLYTNPNLSLFWEIKDRPASPERFGLDFDTDVAGATFGGFYKTSASGIQHGSSDYYRRIIVTEESTIQPYNQNHMSKLKVVAQVWWTNRRCPRVGDFPGHGKCGVEIQTFLTNWKNFGN
jgi:type II secretory pathway pseudopilin PulG